MIRELRMVSWRIEEEKIKECNEASVRRRKVSEEAIGTEKKRLKTLNG